MKLTILFIICSCSNTKICQRILLPVRSSDRFTGNTSHRCNKSIKSAVTTKQRILNLCIPFLYLFIRHRILLIISQHIIVSRRFRIIQCIHFFQNRIILCHKLFDRIVYRIGIIRNGNRHLSVCHIHRSLGTRQCCTIYLYYRICRCNNNHADTGSRFLHCRTVNRIQTNLLQFC